MRSRFGKIDLCDTCQFYSHDPHLVCAVHPYGVHSNECLDYRRREDLIEEDEEQWSPTGYYWYDGELIPIEPQRLTNEERLQILDSHLYLLGFVLVVAISSQKRTPLKFIGIVLLAVGLMIVFRRDRATEEKQKLSVRIPARPRIRLIDLILGMKTKKGKLKK